jgi:hypothetical protein
MLLLLDGCLLKLNISSMMLTGAAELPPTGRRPTVLIKNPD